MSAANFCTMRDFPLFAKDYNEDAKRCPEWSVAYRKYASEVRKINRKLAEFAKAYGFQEYVCTARFSNGEAWYQLASNPRARLKSVVA